MNDRSDPEVALIATKSLFPLSQPPIKKIKSENFFYKYYDGKKIPFKQNSFDRVILSHTLEHIPDPETFMKNVMKININIII